MPSAKYRLICSDLNVLKSYTGFIELQLIDPLGDMAVF